LALSRNAQTKLPGDPYYHQAGTWGNEQARIWNGKAGSDGALRTGSVASGSNCHATCETQPASLHLVESGYRPIDGFDDRMAHAQFSVLLSGSHVELREVARN